MLKYIIIYKGGLVSQHEVVNSSLCHPCGLSCQSATDTVHEMWIPSLRRTTEIYKGGMRRQGWALGPSCNV